MKKLLLENNEVRLELEDGILLAKWKCSFVDLDSAQRAVAYRLESTNFIPYPIVIDIKSIKNVTKPSRDFLASKKGNEGIIAAAIIINSPVGSIIGNFYLRISRPLRPSKLFTDESEAKKWLTTFMEKD